MSNWIDISVPVKTGLVHWPGDVDVRVEQTSFLEKGDSANVSEMSMSVHTGTHMDAPRHFIPGGGSIDRLSLDSLIGPARLLHIPDTDHIDASHLEPYQLQRGERILLRTRNSDRAWWTEPFDTTFAHLSESAGKHLAEVGVVFVGVDYLSVGAYNGDGPETHRALLGAAISIVEGLKLQDIAAGAYDLICLPLRLEGCDGSPARAVIRPIA